MPQVHVDVLGPLRLLVSGEDVRLTSRRERVVLAVLAAAAPAAVPADRLIDDLWGDEPPPTAAGSLHVAISRLRTMLGRDSGAEIVRTAAGYALRGAAVDAEVFRAALSGAAPAGVAATAAPGRGLALAEQALGLWRGDPFADCAEVPSLVPEVERLVEDRLRLEEARAQALLDLGREDEAQAALARVAEEHPFRERLWALRALALYRCDRQAEALGTLRRLREALRDELGVDPSPATRALEDALLAQAAHLSRPPAAAASPPVAPAPPLPAARVLAPRRPPTLVGQAALLEQLTRAVDDLAAGRGGTLVLSGEAGIGKSLLVGELAARAARSGLEVFTGQCHEADVAPPYWPWLPVLRGLREGSGGDDEPELAAVLGAQDPSLRPADGGASALRAFDAVTRLLRSSAPAVVILEDLHWADASSLRLLAYAGEALRDAPVLLVGTVRAVEPTTHPALTAALAALARAGARRLRVPPLDDDAVAALLQQALATPSLDAGLAGVVARRTDGNPFFVLELAGLLEQRGEVTAATARELPVPDGVADVLRLRVLALRPEAREAVSAASVAGRTVEVAVLADVLGRDVLDDLDAAVDGGVLVESGDGGEYRFVHALTRETAYADLPRGRRARWHAAFGAALERRPAAADLLAEIAHHYLQAAAVLPDAGAAAVRAAVRAAHDAERRGAFDEALLLWERALDAERRLPDAEPARRHRMTLDLATARQRVGDMRGMTQALHDAMAAARSRDDAVSLAEAATTFRSSGVWYWREMGTEDSATLSALHESLERVEDVRLRARLWASLGQEQYGLWRARDADESTARGLELARQSGDPETLQVCLAARCLVLWAPGSAAAHEAAAREMVALGLTPEDGISARFHLAVALHHQMRVAEADDVMSEAVERATALRHTNCDVPLAWWRWMRALENGEPDAHERAEEAVSLHRRTTMMSLAEGVGLVALEELPDGADVPADLLALGRCHPHYAVRVAVAHAVLRAGRVEDAVTVAGPLPPVGEHDYASLWGLCRHVDVLVAAGALEDLEELVRRIEPHAGESATFGSVLSDGSAALYLGTGLAGLGRTDEARDVLTQALVANRRAGLGRWEHEARRRLALLPGATAATG